LEKVRFAWKYSVDGLEVSRKLLYAPDHVASDDLVGRMNDAEIRDWWRNWSAGPQKQTFIAEATAGQHEDIVNAMARSPVPDEVQQTGQRILRAVRETKDAKIVGEMQIRDETNDWCQLASNTIIKPVALISTEPGKRLIPIGTEAPAPANIRQMVGAAA